MQIGLDTHNTLQIAGDSRCQVLFPLGTINNLAWFVISAGSVRKSTEKAPNVLDIGAWHGIGIVSVKSLAFCYVKG